ncbi:MAG: hypothetical protein HY829_13745 [Actinobacteria bacterium]|jgi:hypothetical protein|nr:hypothetical protein [Actinomycetota bacterium]
MVSNGSLLAALREALPGPAARTTLILGLLAALLAVAVPLVTAFDQDVAAQVSVQR